MAQLRLPQEPRVFPELQYVRAPRPLHFPEGAVMPEGKTHLTLRTFLYKLLQFALGPEHSVGSEQFVYWNAADTQRCVAPDVFVKLGVPDRQFGNWKTWERGAGVPELAVEIVSPTERGGKTWDEKLAGYFECGIAELARFDPQAPVGEQLRVWDRIRDDLVERVVVGDRTPCLALGLNWTVCPVENEPAGLRLATGEGVLLLNELETETRARAEAEARIRELEDELRRRSAT